MAFLAALALGASLIADRAAEGWQHGLAAKLTVQVRAAGQRRRRGGAGRAKPRRRWPCCAPRPASPMPRRCRTPSSMRWSSPGSAQNGLIADIPLPRLIDAAIMPGAQCRCRRADGGN